MVHCLNLCNLKGRSIRIVSHAIPILPEIELVAASLFLSLFLLHFCMAAAAITDRRNAIRIGIDPNWYPIDFGTQTVYVNGFVEEFLLEVSQQSGLGFERVTANGDTLLEKMKQGHYQAVISSLPPYEFNTAIYDFSHNLIDLGPVLIVPEGGHQNDLEKMNGEHIGVIVGDPAVLLLQKHEGLIVRNYPTVVHLLEAVTNGEIEGLS